MKRVRGELGGFENVKRLHTYIDALRKDRRGLPQRAGGPNLSAIAKACGFDRGVFYTNEEAKFLLDDAQRELGLDHEVRQPSSAFEAARLKDEIKAPLDKRTRNWKRRSCACALKSPS